MIKIVKAIKDTYITNKVVKKTQIATGSNVGIAGTLDLFKIATLESNGDTTIGLSRALVQFDLEQVIKLVDDNVIDTTHPSFFVKMKLYDVYGGQPTPNNFSITVHPLSKSFDEGLGKDIVYYTDYDTSNFITASRASGNWLSPGCMSTGSSVGSICDYYDINGLSTSQLFVTGEEDLEVDVTQIVKSIVENELPNSGFRISFSDEIETDDDTYFVKRFASRHAYDESKHPTLIVGFDDSIRDHTQELSYDSEQTLFLYNFDKGVLTNISGVSGLDCLNLKMQIPVSGGYHELVFSGSQHYNGTIPIDGIYSASIILPTSDPVVKENLDLSGSYLNWTPIWCSTDLSTAYHTGSSVKVFKNSIGSNFQNRERPIVSFSSMKEEYESDEKPLINVNLFDHTSPYIIVSKVPVESPGSFQRIATDAFYRVRNANTNQVIIPFDVEKGSTRISNDSKSLYFKLNMSNLPVNQSYVIDVLLLNGIQPCEFKNASPIFKVVK